MSQKQGRMKNGSVLLLLAIGLIIPSLNFSSWAFSNETIQILTRKEYTGHTHKETHLEKGNEYYQQGQYQLAIDEYQNALFVSTDTAIIRFNLGLAYMKIGKPDKAIRAWQKLIRKTPTTPENTQVLADTYYQLGLLYCSQGQMDLARQETHKLQDLGIDDPRLQELIEKSCPAPLSPERD